jgi:glycosyltransferase involved in cell wall biosynthesis
LGYVFSPGTLLGPVLRPLFWLLQRRASRASHLTVFQNPDDRDYFLARRLVDAEDTAVVLGSGLELGAIEVARRHAVENRLRVRSELGLAEDDFVVLMVARLVKHKGIVEFIEAARRVRQSAPRAKFLLAGPRGSEGWQAVPESLLQQYEGEVNWLGPRKDVPALLAAADLFSLPSYLGEGVPRVLLEAAAFGLPIVTTDMPGCRDVVRQDWNGRLVATRRADELADATLAVMRLSDQERSEWGARGRQHVLDNFLLDKVAVEYGRLYSGLLARVRGG